MAKIAKLVTAVFTTRVVIDDSVADPLQDVEFLERVSESVYNQSLDSMTNYIETIVDDTECPYGTFYWEK